MKQSEKINQLGYSTSTLQSYRNDINMLPPYRIQSNNTNKPRKTTSNTNSNNNIHRNPDLKRPQMTSKDLKRPQLTSSETSKEIRTKNNLEAGSMQENIETNEHYLDEILHYKTLKWN